MSKIKEVIVEPNKIEVGSIFKLKVGVIDNYLIKQIIVSESKNVISTEDGKTIKTEWGK